MTPNFITILAAALIPFVVAIIWFHKSLFGGENWHLIAEMSTEKAATPVKPLKLALSILLNVFISFGVYILSIHESGVFGMVGGDEALMKTGSAAAFLADYGGQYHNAQHGLAHVGYVVIFEKKTAKYFWVYLGYWFVSLTLMSVVICLWGANPV